MDSTSLYDENTDVHPKLYLVETSRFRPKLLFWEEGLGSMIWNPSC